MYGFNDCYGYHFESKKNQFSIIDKEADIVKLIFSNYLKGYGCKTIAQLLTKMNVASPRGLKNWNESTVRNIIKNEKYMGDVIQGKTYTPDPMTHKRVKNNGEEDKYFIKDHHEGIISKEDFAKAQEILKSRSRECYTGRKMSKKFTFSGRFRCGFCGHSYCKKSLYKKRPAWDCISVAKRGREFCTESKVMHEDVIKACFMEAYFLLTANKGLAIEKFISNLRDAAKDTEPLERKRKVENEIDYNKKKLSRLIDLYVEGKVDPVTFEMKKNAIYEKIERYEKQIKQIKINLTEDNKVEMGLKKIKSELAIRESENEIKEFDEDLFEALVDYGIIGGYDENGNKNSYMIRFICKKGFNLRSREDITEDVVVKNNRIDSKDNIFTPIVDFVSNQDFFVFDDSGTRRVKTLISKVRVRVEIEK